MRLQLMLIIGFLAIIISNAAGASEIERAISVIMASKPTAWQVGRIDYENQPRWSRSNDRCVSIELYGPGLHGYIYFDASGRKIAERHFINEALTFWIVPKSFDDGWNPISRLINWLSPWAMRFPQRIVRWDGIEIFAEKSGFVRPENEDFSKNSPLGTRTAHPTGPLSVKTWTTWETDLRSAFDRIPIENGGSR